MWGISSAGRAPALHAGGQEFESPILHHLKESSERTLFFIAKIPHCKGLSGLILNGEFIGEKFKAIFG